MSSAVPQPPSTPPASSSSSPTRTLFRLPDLHRPHGTPDSPPAHGRMSMARSSMATTLGGGRDGAGELASHPGGGQPAGKAARDNGGSNGLNTGSDIAEAQPTGHEKHKAAWERYMVRKNKNHFVAALSEFVGTTLFLFMSFGGANVANIPDLSVTGDSVVNTSQLLYISLSFGFSLTVCAWIFFRVSGGLFNPAVSLGLALVGAITPLRACILVVVQLMGGMTAAALISVLLPGPPYFRTSLSGGISISQGLFLEMFLTSLLMLAILFLAAEKHKATFLAPVGIGLALFIAEMVGVYYTGGSLNPARSFGPDVVAHSFPGYHWIYWLGPAMGAALAAGLYKLLKLLEYEDVVPDQDAGPAAAGAMTDEDYEHHERRIREAESITQTQMARHHEVVQRTGGVQNDQTLTAEHLSLARIGELSAKLDAVMAAVKAIDDRDKSQIQAFVQASRTGTPLPGVDVRQFDAPFTGQA